MDLFATFHNSTKSCSKTLADHCIENEASYPASWDYFHADLKFDLSSAIDSCDETAWTDYLYFYIVRKTGH